MFAVIKGHGVAGTLLGAQTSTQTSTQTGTTDTTPALTAVFYSCNGIVRTRQKPWLGELNRRGARELCA